MSEWLANLPLVPLAVVVAVIGVATLLLKGGGKTKAALEAKLAAGARVFDVRTKAEYAGDHYPGAVNVPLDTLPKKLGLFGAKDAPIVVYCASGGRSSQAAAKLKAAGFTDVTNAGGLANLPR